MKILLVVEPGVDGVFRHVEGLCRYLLQQGVSVHLAYSSVRGSDALVKLVNAVQSHGGKTLDMKVGNAPGLSDIRAFIRLRRLALLVRPDVVHSH
ncbi:MAG: glycosyltransferase, partial [Chthoniobacteraceae bacterium]